MPPSPPPETRARTARRATAALIGAAIAFLLACGFRAREGLIDDAFIYACSVRTLLATGTFSFNPGEAADSCSSPLWSWLLAGAAWLSGSVLGAAALLSFAALAVAAAAASAAVRRLVGATPAATLPAWLLATSIHPYTLNGMETPLLLAALAATALGLAADRRGLALGAAAAACATRPETALLLGPVLLPWLWRRRRRPGLLRDLLLPAVLAAVLVALQLWQFGRLVPDTLTAKTAHAEAGLTSPFLDLSAHYVWFFRADPLLLGTVLALALCGFAAAFRSAWQWALVSGLLAWAGFYLALGLSNYHWYHAPLYLLAWGWAALGTHWLWRRADRIAGTWRRTAARLCIAAAVGYAITAGGIATWRHTGTAAPHAPYRVIGTWIAAHTPPDTTVGIAEVGTIGWFGERRVLDLMGLVTPSSLPFLVQGDMAGWLRAHRPDLLVLHDPLWPQERGLQAGLASGEYAIVHPAALPGYQFWQRR